MYKFVLASQSPRRKELLASLDIGFICQVSTVEEVTLQTNPKEIARELAVMKAEDVAGDYGNGTVIIGADTIVVSGMDILGKPKDREDALRMLRQLQGDRHAVFTGVCLIIKENDKEKVISFVEKTDVSMYEMTDEDINRYIDTEEPYDKAGGYAIQGKAAKFIQKIDGEYANVVGLPIARLYHTLKAHKII
ncbi:Maf family protein [Parasporobacterium paucivorans]|uniref:dTTP/UTP pyrophosphatase n=1 Tax=Parasporobacterium paucivorans DSM 15970 TaxID=1122934 RepID=A0A1M6AIT3_9FIRM|nr:Maf family protein [Parasporobacterium paucivorans]SHI36419.1 septum formation protein [Parasporobacterium paucivorans DSM 15970]